MYADQLPRLHAEETLSSVQAQVAASGQMKKTDLNRYLRDLKRQARGGERPKRTRAANPQQIAGLGIKVEGG